jgi:hypothetical protein
MERPVLKVNGSPPEIVCAYISARPTLLLLLGSRFMKLLFFGEKKKKWHCRRRHCCVFVIFHNARRMAREANK